MFFSPQSHDHHLETVPTMTFHLPPIDIPSVWLLPPAPSPYFRKNSPAQPPPPDTESSLLRAIRKNLRAARGAQESSLRPSVFYSPHADGNTGEEVLTWDNSTVVLTQGGALSKKWTFADPVQWACIGWLYQSSLLHSSTPSTPAYYRESNDKLPPEKRPDERPTFGAYARARMEKKREEDAEERLKGVFIFVRGTAKIYMDNGSEYTLSLPFTVQRAWPVEPHGLFIQRVVEGWEMEENSASEEPRMATIFTLTSPFSEPAALGLTDGVKGGFGSTPLEMKPDYAAEPVPIPPQERILWVSEQAWNLTDRLLVTLNADLNRVTIWRFVYAPPPPSSSKAGTRSSAHTHHAKRSSMSGNTSAHLRQANASLDELQLSPGRRDMKPAHNAPGIAPALTTTTTMAEMMGGALGGSVAQTQWNLPFRFVVDASGKLVLEQVVEQPVDLDNVPDPAEEMRMRSQFWVEKLYEETIPVIA